MRVTIGVRATQQGAIFSKQCYIDTPCVDTDAFDFDVFFGHELQTFDNFPVESIQVPIIVAGSSD